MNVENTVLAAVVVYLAYLLVIGVLWRVGRVRYDRIVESRRSVLVGIVVPIGIGLVLLAAATTALGWWDEVLTQERVGPGWAWAAPILFGVTGLVGVARIDWRHPKARLVPLILVGVLAVGGAEELLNRGLLVAGPELAGWSMLGVWLLSSVLFGLLHALNAFFGLSWSGAVAQVVMAFIGGTALFVTLMVTGSLLACVLLHALWDLGTLGMSATERQPRPWQFGLIGATYLAGLLSVWPIVLG